MTNKETELLKKDIKDYLNYEEDFWNYIKDKIKIIKNPYVDYDLKMHYYGVWYDYNQDKELTKLIICIPDIVDLKTSLIAIHEFRHAHDIYIGTSLDDSKLEEIATLEEKNYLKKKLRCNIS